MVLKFFFNDSATTEIYTNLNTLSLHDALPIWEKVAAAKGLTATGFTALLKTANKYSRAMLNIVDPKSVAAPSTTPSGATHTEVQ